MPRLGDNAVETVRETHGSIDIETGASVRQLDVPDRVRNNRGRRVLIGMLGGSILVAVLAFWTGTVIRGSSGALPQNVSEPRTTIPAGDEVLVESVQGTGVVALSAGTPVTPLTPELSAPGAQPVITAFPWHVGSTVDDADVLVEVAGQPIFVFFGATPTFRDLELGDAGKDVQELQRALRAADYSIDDPSGYLGASTANAIAALYHAHGYSAPMSSAPSAGASLARPKNGGGKIAVTKRAAMLPVWSAIFVKQLPATVSALHTAVGERLGAGASLLDLTSGSPVADVSVEPAIPATLRPGMEVKLTTPDGDRLIGRVRGTSTSSGTSSTGSASAPAPSSTGGSSSTSAPTASSTTGSSATTTTTGSPSDQASTTPSGEAIVVVSLPRGAQDLPIGTSLNAIIVRSSTHHRVLVVPLSAIQAAADGSYYVQVERHGATIRVAVQEGMTAAGNVAVRPVGGAFLRPGEPVVIPN